MATDRTKGGNMETTDETFAQCVNRVMGERGWGNRILAQRAGVSFRTIGDARSGVLEKQMTDPTCTLRKRLGASAATHRLIEALGDEARPWVEKLDLENYHGYTSSVRFHEDTPRVGLESILTEDDIEWLKSTKSVLGDMLTLDTALKFLMKRHKGA